MASSVSYNPAPNPDQALRHVTRCRTHRRAFTLYPLGHVPYGRLAVAPVTLDGQVVLSTQREPAAADRRSPAWRATQLGAAFAALGDPAVKLTDRRWWATQTPERLARSATLLGIHPGLAVPDADAITQYVCLAKYLKGCSCLWLADAHKNS